MNIWMMTAWLIAACRLKLSTDGPDIPLEGFDNTFFGSPDENEATLQAHIFRGSRLIIRFNDILRAQFQRAICRLR